MRRAAFTLVELLVTIAIIAILAGFVLGALYRSQENAKAVRSARTVELLHGVVMEQWEGFRTRRLPVASGTSSQSTDRLVAIWQLMRMELPDRYKDLTFTPTIPEASKRLAYLRRIEKSRVANNVKRASMDPPLAALNAAQYATLIEEEHESSECLYLIMTVGTDPDMRAALKDRDVGDTDNDGVPEILDGWGRPIHFMRWAPGFVSDLQPDADPSTAAIDRDPMSNPNPFDPLRLATSHPSPKNSPPLDSGEPALPAWGFSLTPLIYSAGPDGEYGIYELPQLGAISGSIVSKNNNPYSRYDNGVTHLWRGTANDSVATTHQDNIHNHALTLTQ